MLTSFLVVPHMLKLVVTHAHTWSYRKSEVLTNVFLFIYKPLEIKHELSFDQVWTSVLDVIIYRQKARIYGQKNQRTDILLSKDWLSQRVKELLRWSFIYNCYKVSLFDLGCNLSCGRKSVESIIQNSKFWAYSESSKDKRVKRG